MRRWQSFVPHFVKSTKTLFEEQKTDNGGADMGDPEAPYDPFSPTPPAPAGGIYPSRPNRYYSGSGPVTLGRNRPATTQARGASAGPLPSELPPKIEKRPDGTEVIVLDADETSGAAAGAGSHDPPQGVAADLAALAAGTSHGGKKSLEDEVMEVMLSASTTAAIERRKAGPGHGTVWCGVCQTWRPEDQPGTRPADRHEASIGHQFRLGEGDGVSHAPGFVLPAWNKGAMMLRKSEGWDGVSGLGKEANGRLFPIKTKRKVGRVGLGHHREKEEVERVTHIPRSASGASGRPKKKKNKGKKKKKSRRNIAASVANIVAQISGAGYAAPNRMQQLKAGRAGSDRLRRENAAHHYAMRRGSAQSLPTHPYGGAMPPQAPAPGSYGSVSAAAGGAYYAGPPRQVPYGGVSAAGYRAPAPAWNGGRAPAGYPLTGAMAPSVGRSAHQPPPPPPSHPPPHQADTQRRQEVAARAESFLTSLAGETSAAPSTRWDRRR